MKDNTITPVMVRNYFNQAADEEISEILDEGLLDAIHRLEEDDFFGTEGFEKRWS